MMDLEIGSNIYRNTDGTVEVEGVPQLTVTLKRPDGPPIVNFVTFDASGRMTSKMVESTLQFNERRALELAKTPTGLKLTHAESDKVVLHVEVQAPGHVVIKQASFVTAKGHTMDISLVEWKVEKRRMSGSTTDVKGGAVAIG
ncbi:MAG: hypothetical protein A3H49_02860 [Nitrospirae bacterium RIFCSPLOWO2_02_FULL_62_14]|nr:MAG: hypothetical protein A3H49_02860 [Nitrospirae bacterium RIFCSPLOWO2_02_FULL_62_14]OGW68344.1 MAG: hypothetical protein A3A88_04990 [Nitrospirae bacterium RIFCSPLOWO2_01_FULL_62_17]